MLGTVMPIKDRLRQLRKAAGMTQQALAVKAGLSVTAIVHIEGGRIDDPRGSTLKAIARALGVSLDELMRDDSEGTAPDAPEPPAPKRPRKRKGE
jgi:transcriptional regulator with XRE-family HTH domain